MRAGRCESVQQQKIIKLRDLYDSLSVLWSEALDDGRMQWTNSSMTIEYRHSSGKYTWCMEIKALF